MKYLLSTVSYPVMNLVLNIDRVAKMKATPEYKEAQTKATKQRLMSIVWGRPYQPVFGEAE